ncbi:glutamate racemase [bacterium]|nr:glutamate racemase [bacterium]
MKNTQPIAFFDSGVGGVTVYQKVKKILANENFMYYGDTKHLPYGEKTKAQLLDYAKVVFDFFAEREVKALVMACNTTSSVVYDEMKDKYDFKVYPIIQSAAKIIASQNIERIGVFATEATVKSGAYERELKKYNKNLKVFSMYCPEWVKIVEENSKEKPENISIIKFYLDEMLKNNPEKIVLGCTHYPYLTEVLSKFAPKTMFIDPAVYFADYIAKDLKVSGLLTDSEKEGYEKFFVSSNPENFYSSARMFYPIKSVPELV